MEADNDLLDITESHVPFLFKNLQGSAIHVHRLTFKGFGGHSCGFGSCSSVQGSRTLLLRT